jgi:hypothetical protein
MAELTKNRWVIDIMIAMANLGGKASYAQLYQEVRKVRPGPLPRTWDAIVRNTVESHSSDSENWSRARPDYFYSVEGKGSGIWGLRTGKNVGRPL